MLLLCLSACAGDRTAKMTTSCQATPAVMKPSAGRSITVALGEFDPALHDLCVTGHVQGHELVPDGPTLPAPVRIAEAAAPQRVTWQAAAFTALPGWRDDAQAEALAAFLRTCLPILRKPAGSAFGAFGPADRWQEACRSAPRPNPGDNRAARNFFETAFTPWQVAANGNATGLFTGYYEPVLDGSRVRSAAYSTPLRALPGDMVGVRPSDFIAGATAKRLTGRIAGDRLRPYPDRQAIIAGALAPGQDRPLVWVRDPVEAFFLQIQGSGIVRFADGSAERVGYAGQNGRPYLAIGGEIVRRGGLRKEDVSADAIKQWLRAHPDQADGVMDANRSYVFFRPLAAPAGDGPPGGAGVPLTGLRSLAVDRATLPYGVPVWIDAASGGAPFRRLMVAQDTGGAIKGAVRGDIFWGRGDAAARAAGAMKSPGRMWVLLPRGVTPGP